MRQRKVPVPDVGPLRPFVLSEKEALDKYVGWGRGGTYTAENDPMPAFNYVGAALVTQKGQARSSKHLCPPSPYVSRNACPPISPPASPGHEEPSDCSDDDSPNDTGFFASPSYSSSSYSTFRDISCDDTDDDIDEDDQGLPLSHPSWEPPEFLPTIFEESCEDLASVPDTAPSSSVSSLSSISEPSPQLPEYQAPCLLLDAAPHVSPSPDTADTLEPSPIAPPRQPVVIATCSPLDDGTRVAFVSSTPPIGLTPIFGPKAPLPRGRHVRFATDFARPVTEVQVTERELDGSPHSRSQRLHAAVSQTAVEPRVSLHQFGSTLLTLTFVLPRNGPAFCPL